MHWVPHLPVNCTGSQERKGTQGIWDGSSTGQLRPDQDTRQGVSPPGWGVPLLQKDQRRESKPPSVWEHCRFLPSLFSWVFVSVFK